MKKRLCERTGKRIVGVLLAGCLVVSAGCDTKNSTQENGNTNVTQENTNSMSDGVDDQEEISTNQGEAGLNQEETSTNQGETSTNQEETSTNQGEASTNQDGTSTNQDGTSTNQEGANEQEDETLLELREEAKKEECYCAVAYLGYVEDNSIQSVREGIEKGFDNEKYSFLDDLQEEDIVTVGGCDLYCIVPVEGDTEVTIERIRYDEEGEPVIEEVIAQRGVKPFVLLCNESDIMTNVSVTIKTGNQTYAFSPYISLKDGTLAIQSDDLTIFTFNQEKTGKYE